MNDAGQTTNVRILRTMYRWVAQEYSFAEAQMFLDELGLEKRLLDDENEWVSFEVYYRAWDVLRQIAPDPSAPFKIGQFTISKANLGSVWYLVRATGDAVNRAQAGYAFIPKAANRLSRIGRFDVERSGYRSSRLRWTQYEGFPHRAELCEYRRGLLSAGPFIGDLPPATVDEPECIERGGTACIYEVAYTPRRTTRGRRIGALVGIAGGAGLAAADAGVPAAAFFGIAALALGLSRDAYERSAVNRATMTDQFTELLGAKMRLEQDYRELRETRLELARKERLASLGELSAKLAHELRNPLGIIKGSAEVLRKPPDGDDVRDEMTSFIIEEAERMNASITNFLVFARPMKSNRVRTNLAALVERLIGEWNARSEPGVSIRFERAGQIPPVLADPHQVHQALLNLVLNASEAMGGTGEISIEARMKDGSVECAVADDGPGFPDDARERVWDPFFTTKDFGTGLGLTNVRQIVTANGGTVDLGNRPEGGARVVVGLEAAPCLEARADIGSGEEVPR